MSAKLAKARRRQQHPLAASHESIVNNAPRLFEDFEVGSVSHQGDLIIVRIAALPLDAKPRKDRQLADGDTQGSRHVLTRGEVYDAPAATMVRAVKAATGCEVGEQYVGPVFVSPEEPSAKDLDHPEHGPQGFPAGAVCAVVFQRSLDAEQREQRVAD